jgi:hypothetical protein
MTALHCSALHCVNITFLWKKEESAGEGQEESREDTSSDEDNDADPIRNMLRGMRAGARGRQGAEGSRGRGNRVRAGGGNRARGGRGGEGGGRSGGGRGTQQKKATYMDYSSDSSSQKFSDDQSVKASSSSLSEWERGLQSSEEDN